MEEIDALLWLERLEELHELDWRSQLLSRKVRDRINPFEDFDDNQFTAHFRLPKASILHLIGLIEEQSSRTYSHSFSVSTWLRGLIVMWFYFIGAQQILIGDYADLHQSTVSRIVKWVSVSLAHLRHRFIFFPSEWWNKLYSSKSSRHRIVSRRHWFHRLHSRANLVPPRRVVRKQEWNFLCLVGQDILTMFESLTKSQIWCQLNVNTVLRKSRVKAHSPIHNTGLGEVFGILFTFSSKSRCLR